MASSQILKQHLDNLLQETGNIKDFRTTIDTILRVHKNIRRNPENKSYRRLNYAMNDDLHQMWQYDSVRLFLYDLGWIHDEKFLFCKSLEFVELALEVLQDYRSAVPYRFTINFDINDKKSARKTEKMLNKKSKEASTRGPFKGKKHKASKLKADVLNKKHQLWIERTYFMPVSASGHKIANKTLSHRVGRLILSDHPIVVPIPKHAAGTTTIGSCSSPAPIKSKSIPGLNSTAFEKIASRRLSKSCVKDSTSPAVAVVAGLCNTAANTVCRLEHCLKKISFIPINPISISLKSETPSTDLRNGVNELENVVGGRPANACGMRSSTSTITAVNFMSGFYTTAVNVAYGLEHSTKNIVSKLATVPLHFKCGVVTKSID